MAEHRSPPTDRDLVGELRRVDNAFAGLKAGRSDVVDRLLAGDTDELVRQSERHQRGSRLRAGATVVGTFALALATVVAVRLVPAVEPAVEPVAETTTRRLTTVALAPPAAALTTTTAPATTAAAQPSTAQPSTALATTTAATTTAAAKNPPPTLRQVQLRRPASGAPGALAAFSGAELRPLASGTRSTVPADAAAVDLDAVGVAAPVELTPGDDDVEEAVRGARRLAARGALDEAIAVLGALLERGPAPRVVDVVMVELARLQHRAGHGDEACITLSAHRRRFPTSDNATLVDAERARWSCR